MSEVVRNYTGQAGSRKVRRAGRARGRVRAFVFAAAALTGLVLWLTRDSYSVVECMPGGARYTLVITDPMNSRARITDSLIWSAWPAGDLQAQIRQMLTPKTGFPQWVLNNLVTEHLYVLGNDLDAFSDVLVVTKMSRIGCLLERLHRVVPGISNEYAGGLRLRALDDPRVYYAVRGRVLVLSPSRDKLIHALTLAEGASFDEAVFEDLTLAGSEDIRGTIQLVPEDPAGASIESLAFALRVGELEGHARVLAIVRDSAQDRLGPLLNGVSPRTLQAPVPGPVEISVDFAKPVRDVWASLGHAFEVPWLSAERWQSWEAPEEPAPRSFAQIITELLGPLGPGIRLTCRGFDLNEMLPVPELVCTVDADARAIADSMAVVPPPPPDIQPWDTYPRYDPESRTLRLPMIGGPSIEPTAGVYGGNLLISSSRTAAEQVLAEPPNPEALPGAGNLYVRVKPGDLVEDIVGALRLFAEEGLLRGYSAETFEQDAARWMQSCARIHELTALCSVQGDTLDLELKVVCRPTSGVSSGEPD